MSTENVSDLEKVDRLKVTLKELSLQFPDAFQKNIYFDEEEGRGPKNALYVAASGEEHIILRENGRLMRYTISMSILNTECYVPKKESVEMVENYLQFGQRAVSILRARSELIPAK